MALFGGERIRNFYVVDTSTNTTLTAVKAGDNINAAIIEQDGSAVAASKPFALAKKNNKGEITLSDIIHPERVSDGRSVPYVARQGKSVKITDIVAEANKLYQVTTKIKGHGSLSMENEYIKEAFYKSKTGDDAEDIVDGLVKSLARNFGREQPQTGETFEYTLKNGSTVNLATNQYFDFEKTYSDGTSEVSTLTITSAPTSDGNVKVTLDGVQYEIPVSTGTANASATEIAAGIDELDAYSASAATNVVTITAVDGENEVDTSFAAGDVEGIEATAATTTQGDAGTSANAELRITEKSGWLAKYYVTGRKDRLHLDYSIDAFFPTLPTVTESIGNVGTGTGYQVRNLEYYFVGQRGDTFRTMGYPHNFDTEYDSKLTGSYTLIELAYYDESRQDPMKSKKQLTIACASSAVANTLIEQINTALTGTGIQLETV